MPREFPDGFEEILNDLNRGVDGADAPEDQALGRRSEIGNAKTNKSLTPLEL